MIWVAALILLAAGAVAVARKALDPQSPHFNVIEESPQVDAAPRHMPYRKRTYFFTRSERAFYSNLLNALPPGHTAFAKVRLADLLEIDGQGRSYFRAFGQISQKHVDFVVCDEHYRPYLAIELDGKSHERKRQQKADETKDLALEAAGLQMRRFRVGEAWNFSDLGLNA